MKRHLLIAFFSSLVALGLPLPQDIITRRPKLVLVLVIDQFRADYLTRFERRFLPAKKSNGEVGGFKYLMSQGAYFPLAEYGLLQNMTGPGHSTILTGAYPYQSGIPLNTWFDKEKNASVYCVQDESSPLVGTPNNDLSKGVSPRNLYGTTVGDELKNAGYPSRVVSIALKDRAAIFMAGHRADAAFWFDPEFYQWVSSKFYFPEGKLPAWLQKINTEIKKQDGKHVKWLAAGPSSGLSTSDKTINLGNWTRATFKAEFPHEIQVGMQGSLSSPLGGELTFSLVEKALAEFQLGKGKGTDLLAVSLSSHDYLGHAFGPNSLEMEEITVSEDQQISGFLNRLKKHLPGGLSEVTIVLTADHGIPPIPEWLKKERVAAGRIDEKVLIDELNAELTKKYGAPGSDKWIANIKELNIFINHAAISEKKIDQKAFEETLRNYLTKVEGVARIVTQTDIRNHQFPPGLFETQLLHSYFPGRSGDILIIPRPFYFSGEDTTGHMTGYSYDRTVPLIFAGPHIRPGIYATPAHVIDIAPTLAFLLGTVPPALSEGKVLSEILK